MCSEVSKNLDCKTKKERIFCNENGITSNSQKPKCKICSLPSKFNDTKNIYNKTCSKSCYNEWRKQDLISRKTKENNLLLQNKDEYFECKVCGTAVKAIASHLKLKKDEVHKDWDLKRYRKEFPNEPIISKKTSQILSEQSKGEKNAMHRTKTTKEFRQSNSPCSIEFYKRKFPNETLKQQQKRLKDFIEGVDYSERLTESNLEYWIEKCGGDLEKANRLYKERQRTFTKEKCIEKYGEEKGLEVWRERQEKWSTKMENMYKEGKFSRYNNKTFSKLSMEIIDNLPKEDAHFNENEFWIREGQRFYYVDYERKGKIIEINGDYWHCNPEIYQSDYFHKNKNMYAHQIWDYDNEKLNTLQEKGYQVLVIWEKDFNNDKEGTIRKCLEFLND